VRLFVALDLPESARSEVARWRDAVIGGREDLRPVRVADLHVTLVFLGWTDPDRVAAIWEATGGTLVAGAVPPVLTPAGLTAVPKRRPRLVALDLSDERGRAAALQRALADALAAAELHEPEQRPFWPHVTLARLRKGARWRPLEGAPGLAPFDAAAVTLYRSHSSASGARYEALHSHPLGETQGK
jgi:2'-5' RNA ligase